MTTTLKQTLDICLTDDVLQSLSLESSINHLEARAYIMYRLECYLRKKGVRSPHLEVADSFNLTPSALSHTFATYQVRSL